MAAAIPDSVVKGEPEGKLILYGGAGTVNDTIGNVSPYTGKVEAFLRMNGIPYGVGVLGGDYKKSPKKMAPFIQHGDVLLADSTFIMKYLANTYADTLKVDYHTDPFKAGIAVAAEILCEDHLLHGFMWHRWLTDEGYQGMWKLISKHMSFPVALLFLRGFRRKMKNKLYHQGFARHSRNDAFKIIGRDMEALSGMLGKSKYITGDEPCPQDCAVFAILDVYLNSKIVEKDPLRDLVMKYDNLVAYVSNMQKELYPEDNPSQFKQYKI